MILPLVHKLWDKGVDIAAGVITSVFVAGIGLASWRLKLWLDLRADKAKFLQHKELERQNEREKEMARRATLAQQRERFAAAAEQALNRNSQGELWDEVLAWMKSEGLLEIQANLQIYYDRADWGERIRRAAGGAGHPETNAVNLAKIIRSIELPPMDVS